MMTYHDGRCAANCQFCPQARESKADIGGLSRVPWPRRSLEEVLRALSGHQGELRRVCVQAVNYPGVVGDLCKIVAEVKGVCDLPVSVSCQPLGEIDVRRLADAGIDRLGIPLDAATPEIFDRIKGGSAGGSYKWHRHLQALEEASSILGSRVSTHLIVGLGESEREMIELIQFLHDRGITVGLFAFTPIPGTPLAGLGQPNLSSYRRIQLARHLIVQGLMNSSEVNFEDGRVVDFGTSYAHVCTAVNSGEPFRTSGCPGCNRPFYNESPRGPIYNYPRKLSPGEIDMVREQLEFA
jgi:biotin synthase